MQTICKAYNNTIGIVQKIGPSPPAKKYLIRHAYGPPTKPNSDTFYSFFCKDIQNGYRAKPCHFMPFNST